jgi:ribosomal protein S18 acetylase RimI-like enzyme
MTQARPSFSITELFPADAADYNAFLRRGLEQHPDTLRIAIDDQQAAPFETPNGAEGASFVAKSPSGDWLGVVTLERERGRLKRRHIAWILRMYVAAQSSGGGVGRALLRAALARARACPGVEKVNLTVAAHNARAVGLYESEGFEVFAREADAFRDPTPRTELTMSLSLSRRS